MDHRLFRLLLNVYPPLLGAGITLDRVSADFTEVDVSMPLRWYNRNYVRTHFGGSLYAMTDPFLMLMLMQQIGRDFIVWDKAAAIDFIAPGRSRVHAQFRMPRSEVERLQREAASGAAVLPEYSIDVTDAGGVLVARVRKTLYVRRKKPRDTR